MAAAHNSCTIVHMNSLYYVKTYNVLHQAAVTLHSQKDVMCLPSLTCPHRNVARLLTLGGLFCMSDR
jgi:hypothetical protein